MRDSPRRKASRARAAKGARTAMSMPGRERGLSLSYRGILGLRRILKEKCSLL